MAAGRRFSEAYVRARCAREGEPAIREHVVQCLWYDQLFATDTLTTHDGQPVRVLSPGWWNHGEGPDFRGAQIEISGNLRTGDVEIHMGHGVWRAHGHHRDSRYDEVILEVVLESRIPKRLPVTSQGRAIPVVLLANHLEGDIRDLAEGIDGSGLPPDVELAPGHCAGVTAERGIEPVTRFVRLAGEWRLLSKARRLRERIEKDGPDQAVYEIVASACGFSQFKHHFRVIARAVPYERARELARRDPMLLEAAYLQLAGLLPDDLPEDAPGTRHLKRLQTLRGRELPGLKGLPMQWKRSGVRPNNYPERRLAGLARLVSRTAKAGLTESLERVWREDRSPIERRRAFEALFPSPMGFWADHYSWTGKRLDKPVAMIGGGRVRSIIGNVFVPAALAMARQRKDRTREESVFAFFTALPKEADNHVLKRMEPRVYGNAEPPRLTFGLQQGLLQIYLDWCESNPSCRNCPVIAYLADGESR